MLKYADIIGDFPRIVQHHVQEEDWGEALRQLSRQVSRLLEFVFRIHGLTPVVVDVGCRGA